MCLRHLRSRAERDTIGLIAGGGRLESAIAQDGKEIAETKLHCARGVFDGRKNR